MSQTILKRFIYLCTIAGVLGFPAIGWGQTTDTYPGDIVITEYMADPDSVGDSNGEYIELYNTRSYDIDIDGYVIKDDGSNEHTINNGGSLTIPSESFIVLAVSSDPAGDASITPDYVYSSFTLSNSSDEIILVDADGIEIARLEYGNYSTGISHELDSITEGIDGITGDSDYSEATATFGKGDKGSPGSAGNTDTSENPTIRFESDSYSASESDASVTIKVYIEDPDGSNTVTGDISFLESISSGESSDFSTTLDESFSFASSAADGDSKSFTFNINNDSDYEGEETFVISLTNLSSGGTISSANPDSVVITLTDDDQPDVVISEFLADPDGTTGDANGDGSVSTSQDEFIEIVNNEYREIDISGWTLSEETGVKFTVSDGIYLPARGSMVVFAGGTPTGYFGGALVFTAGSLSLNNTGDSIYLRDSSGVHIDSLNYGSEAGDNQSIVLDGNRSGSYAKHSTVGSGNDYSPGVTTSDELFNEDLHLNGTAGWRMLSAPVDNWELNNLNDDIPLQGIGSDDDLNIYTNYSGSAFEGPSALTDQLSSGNGFILYVFNNTDGGSSSLPVNVDIDSGTEPSSDVTVSLHASGDNWNLVGNPFKSPIDVTAITANGGTLNSAVGQIWDNESGSYITSTTNGNKVLPWQGFFIENTDAASITIPTSAKTTGNDAQLYKSSDSEQGYVHFTVTGPSVNPNKPITDQSTVLYFSESATHEWDMMDAQKLASLSGQYALMNLKGSKNGEIISKTQDSRPLNLESPIRIPVEFQTTISNGEITLTWDLNGQIPEDWSIVFEDNYTGKQYDLRVTDSIKIPVSTAIKSSSKQKGNTNPGTSVVWSSDDNSGYEIIVSPPTTTGFDEPGFEEPNAIKLLPNYPNPFNPSTQIKFFLPEKNRVKLAVYNVVGQKVAELTNGVVAAGEHSVTWTATDVPSGIYIYQLEVGSEVFTRKMTLIK